MNDKEKIKKAIELLEQYTYQWKNKDEIIVKVLQILKEDKGKENDKDEK